MTTQREMIVNSQQLSWLAGLRKGGLPWFVAITVMLGVVYWLTMLPGVGYQGDMAKFQFLGRVLGTPHASGYPTYVMLNALFVRLVPFGTLAWRANLLSAVFAIVAAWFLFATLDTLAVKRPVSLAATLTFGLGQAFWSFSLVADVYTLQAAFLAAVLYFLVRWRSEFKERYFTAACLAYALSFGNHLIALSLLPAFAWMVWATDRSVFRQPRKIAIVLGCILAGVLQYGYILWRSGDPDTPFLEIDSATLFNFIISAGTESSAFKGSLAEIVGERLPGFAGFVWQQYTLLIIPVILGAFILKDRVLNSFLLLGIAGTTLFCLNLSMVREAAAFYFSVYLFLAVYLALGMDWISSVLLRKPRSAWIWLLAPALLLVVNYRKVDESQHTLHARIVEKALTTAGEQSVILVDEYDYAAYFWYYLLGEGYGQRNLYSFPLDYVGPEGVRAYLQGRSQFRVDFLKLALQPGLEVYVLWRATDPLRQAGMVLDETETRYLYRVRLPEP